MKTVEEIRKAAMKTAVYDLATAMKEAEDVCEFAKLHKNAMACCKATELRAKLSGLLIERVEVVAVDLKSALDKAERRVIDVTTVVPLANPSFEAPTSVVDPIVTGLSLPWPWPAWRSICLVRGGYGGRPHEIRQCTFQTQYL